MRSYTFLSVSVKLLFDIVITLAATISPIKGHLSRLQAVALSTGKFQVHTQFKTPIIPSGVWITRTSFENLFGQVFAIGQQELPTRSYQVQTKVIE